MKRNEFLDKMELIDPVYIEESESETKKSSAKRLVILVAAALILCISAAAIPLAVNKEDTKPNYTKENISTEDVVPTEEVTENESKETDEFPTPPLPASDIPYSMISLPPDDNFTPSESTTQGGAMGDIAPFFEEFTADCDFIEGKVINVYEKHYEYTVISHKFKGGNRAVCYTDSVIYEFEISRVWRGEFTEGETILIEDMQMFCGSQFYMQKGHSYLVPIRDAGEDIAILSLNADTAEGETKRQTPYTTEYPYHPQIEITLDGYYLFPNDWSTLAEPGERLFKVIDVRFDRGSVYYEDKMLLLDPESFEIQMKKMLSQ